jgi:SAM-dependent methyltransferase
MMTDYIRTTYAFCPICDSRNFSALTQFDCRRHPLWRPGLPFVINWSKCKDCGHVFTNGYLEGEALDFLLERGQHDQFPRIDENSRLIASLLIDKVAAPHESFSHPASSWLDVGFGSGALVMTAAEYGYTAIGLDLRQQNVDALLKLGYEAFAQTIEEYAGETHLSEAYNVISMLEVLEHMPFPRTALDAAHKLLRFDGALIVSCPNMDTALWREMDAHNQNPYWMEIEHYHNFTRERLSALLEDHGFSPVSYHVSPRYKSCMEIIAMKKEMPNV